MKRVGSLFNDPKYADLQVRCDGKIFYVHRAIVCSVSEVLANECEVALKVSDSSRSKANCVLTHLQGTNGKLVEYQLYDASTLQSMLQWMYEGDYAVDVASSDITTRNGSNGLHTNGDKDITPLPHLRKSIERAPAVQSPVKHNAEPPANAMEAHVLVYGISIHYGLPELQAKSLKKFQKAKEMPDIGCFLSLVKVIYRNTPAQHDLLRKEFLDLMLKGWSSLLTDECLARALAADSGLYQFGVDIAIATMQHLTEMTNQKQMSSETQATASKLLLTDLDQTHEALAKSAQRNKALESELKAAKLENEGLAIKSAPCLSELESGSETIRLLQADVEKATTERGSAASRATQAESQAVKLGVDLRKSREQTTKRNEQVNTAHAKLQAKEEELKRQTVNTDSAIAKLTVKKDELQIEKRRANSNNELANQKEATIQSNKTRFNHLLHEEDKAIASEKSRANKGLAIVKSIVCMVNDVHDCRHCGEGLQWRLQPDDRINIIGRKESMPFNSMLRCKSCQTKEYGDLIYVD